MLRRFAPNRFAAFLAGAAVVAILTGLSGSASAGEREEARRHFKSGMEAIQNGQYEKGIAELKEAYAILPHPNVLYNIARAYAEMGDLENAVAGYRRYLAENPPDKDEVEAVVKALEARLAKSKAAAAAAAAAAGAPTPASGAPAGGEAGGGPARPTAGVTGKVSPVVGAVPGAAPTGGQEEIGGRKEENVYEERVITASKGAQSPLDSPNSTYVITEQDIRLSGLTSIPELLRRVPGIDFMQITATDYDLSMRGQNSRLSNKLLVLVNGRSVFLDFLGTTFWDILTVGVEDIERIEVVRGPGSALYGADAFAGVVNIITKEPGEGPSGVSASVGTQRGAPWSSYHGVAWATGHERRWNYRVSAGYEQYPRWSREVGKGRTDLGYFTPNQDLGTTNARIDFRVTRPITKDVNFGIGTGYSRFYRNFYGIGPFTDAAAEGQTGEVTAFVTSKHVNARVFWNWTDASAGVNVFYLGDPSFRTLAKQNVVDGELEYVTDVRTGPVAHDLHLGVGYRLKTIHWNYLDKILRTESHFAAYAQDTLRFGERVAPDGTKYAPFLVVGSLRGDYVPYLAKVIPSPRASAIFKPRKDEALRFTIGSAFRAPSYLESYLDFPVTTPLTGAEVASQALRVDDPGFRVQPERILTTEIGYQNQISDYYTFEITSYYNRVTDLIALDTTRPQTPSAYARGAGGYDEQTGRYVVSYGGFANDCQIYNVFGGELSARVFPVTGLDIYGSYALNYTNQVAPSGCVGTLKDDRTSRHKITAGAQVRTRYGFDAELDMWFVSRQVWAEQQPNFTTRDIEYHPYDLPASLIFNGRVGYRFRQEPLEVGIAGTNLLDTIHREHPFGQRIGRRIMLQGSYKF